jgi:hypothetical protein
MSPQAPGRHWRLLTFAGLAAILATTLYPIPSAERIADQTPLLCLVCGENGGADVIQNLLLFAPFAIGLRLYGWSWIRVTVACAALSFSVELCQYLWVPGRDASLSDVLTNTSGGSAAAAVAPLLRVALAPGEREAQRLLFCGATSWIAFSLFTAWLFSPWVSNAAALSEWSTRSDREWAYEGDLRNIVLSGDSMPNGWLDAKASGRIADLFALETLDIRVDLVSSAPPKDLEWIYRVGFGPGRLTVNQKKTALVVEIPRRLALLEVNSPTLRLDAGAPDRAGVPFSITAGERGEHVWLESTVNGRTRRVDMMVAPTMAWGLVTPFGYTLGPEAKWITMIWVAALMAPLGLWGASTGRPATTILMLAASIAIGLGLIPWLSPAGSVPAGDWLAAALGAIAGWAARAPAAYLATRCGSPSASESSSS